MDLEEVKKIGAAIDQAVKKSGLTVVGVVFDATSRIPLLVTPWENEPKIDEALIRYAAAVQCLSEKIAELRGELAPAAGAAGAARNGVPAGAAGAADAADAADAPPTPSAESPDCEARHAKRKSKCVLVQGHAGPHDDFRGTWPADDVGVAVGVAVDGAVAAQTPSQTDPRTVVVIGRVVHFRLPESFKHAGEERPATIVRVNDAICRHPKVNALVSLDGPNDEVAGIAPPGGLAPMLDTWWCSIEHGHRNGEWHWPHECQEVARRNPVRLGEAAGGVRAVI